MRSVLVIGATGLVGSQCVRLLIADPSCSRVVVVARSERPAGVDSRKVEWHSMNLDDMASHPGIFAVNKIICAIGTTVRKTPSRELYRRIDYEYPLTAARLGLEQGATHYLVVTAIGANSRSRLFYNRLKGELEDSLRGLAYPSLTIVRPSVLKGERKEMRRSEKLAWKLAFLTPKKYKPVESSAVALALVEAARSDVPGVRIIENRDILR